MIVFDRLENKVAGIALQRDTYRNEVVVNWKRVALRASSLGSFIAQNYNTLLSIYPFV